MISRMKQFESLCLLSSVNFRLSSFICLPVKLEKISTSNPEIKLQSLRHYSNFADFANKHFTYILEDSTHALHILSCRRLLCVKIIDDHRSPHPLPLQVVIEQLHASSYEYLVSAAVILST